MHGISKSTLSRFILSAGVTRKERLKDHDDEQNLKFAFLYPLECVQADDLHAFPVPDDRGKKRKAILMAFIDDATRRIVYANFSPSERSLAFEAGIKHILKAHGRIVRLYVDNGSPFVSSQTRRILDILGVHLIHSRPGRPKGRGKIERFFRTVRDQFLRPLDQESISGLADLNIRFRTWLEGEYHRNPHRGINNKTPLDAWLEGARHLVAMDPSIDIDRAFHHITFRKVYGDSTFTVDGVLYETSSILCGKKIRASFDPEANHRRILVEYDGRSFGEARAVNTYANTKVVRNRRTHGYTPAEELPAASDSAENKTSSVRTLLGAVTFESGKE